MRKGQQTYILITRNIDEAVIVRVGQSVYLHGVLSSGTPPASWRDSSHGIPNATANVQSLNSDVNTSMVNIQSMFSDEDGGLPFTRNTRIRRTLTQVKAGTFVLTLTPAVVGVYTYRITYDGESQCAPAVSNNVTLTMPLW